MAPGTVATPERPSLMSAWRFHEGMRARAIPALPPEEDTGGGKPSRVLARGLIVVVFSLKLAYAAERINKTIRVEEMQGG